MKEMDVERGTIFLNRIFDSGLDSGVSTDSLL